MQGQDSLQYSGFSIVCEIGAVCPVSASHASLASPLYFPFGQSTGKVGAPRIQSWTPNAFLARTAAGGSLQALAKVFTRLTVRTWRRDQFYLEVPP